MTKFFLALLFLAPEAHAARAVMEQTVASNATIFVDTQNIRVGIATGTPSITLDVNGNAMFGAAANRSTFTATGQLNVIGGASALTVGVSSLVVTLGNVGVGTANPALLLDVNGNAIVRGYETLTGTATVQGNAFSVGGSTFAVIGGSVGVRTGSPVNALDINGTLAVGSYAGVNTAPSGGMIVSGNVGIGTTNPFQRFMVSDSGANNIVMAESTTGPSRVLMQASANGPTTIGSSTNHDLQIITNNAEKARITAAGNVGIATTNPLYTLDIAGSRHVSGQDVVGGTSTVQGNAFSVGGSTFAVIGGSVGVRTGSPVNALDVSGSVGIGTYAGANAGPSNSLIVSGNTGIGTSNPLTKFDVLDSGHALFSNFGCGGSIEGIGLDTTVVTGCNSYAIAGDAVNTLINANTGGYVDFRINNSSKMRLASTGNVGIATTNPQNFLDINGTLAVGSYAGVNTAPSGGMIVSGNVGIGTTNPFQRFTVSDSGANNIVMAESTTGPSRVLMQASANGPTTIGSSTNHLLQIITNNTVRINVLASGSITTGQALCLDASNNLGHCTSAVGAGGGCTCTAP